jgi:hypothetical protein
MVTSRLEIARLGYKNPCEHFPSACLQTLQFGIFEEHNLRC